MNRMEEYELLLEDLEQIPAKASGSVRRAKARRNRQKYLWKPLTSVAAVFVLFVGLVNLCPPVAAACMEIPFLKELAEAVSFSPSLSKAVENEFVQYIGQEQTQNGITVRVEHLIVDQKNVNIFYYLTSDRYEINMADIDFLNADGNRLSSCSWSTGASSNEELRQTELSFVSGDVPNELLLTLTIRENDLKEKQPTVKEPAPERSTDIPDEEMESPVVAEFQFLLQFDPDFTQQGQVIPVNQIAELDGNRVTIRNIEVYPTQLRVEVWDDPANLSSAHGLNFCVLLEDGTEIDGNSSSITSCGGVEPDVTYYYLDSTYFLDSPITKLEITSAKLLEKGKERFYVDLETGENDLESPLTEFYQAERTDFGWKIVFREPETEIHASPISWTYFDREGKSYSIGQRSWEMYIEGTSEDDGYDYSTYYLMDYTQNEAWFELTYTKLWAPETPVVLEIEP